MMKLFSNVMIACVLFAFAACSGGNQNTGSSTENNILEPADIANEHKAGELLYLRYCMACHQTDGSGVPAMYPPLINSPTVNSGKKEDFILVLLNGLKGPIEVHGKKYNQQMPAQDFLTDEELALIINYVGKSFKNNGAEVTPDEVKALRKK